MESDIGRGLQHLDNASSGTSEPSNPSSLTCTKLTYSCIECGDFTAGQGSDLPRVASVGGQAGGLRWNGALADLHIGPTAALQPSGGNRAGASAIPFPAADSMDWADHDINTSGRADQPAEALPLRPAPETIRNVGDAVGHALGKEVDAVEENGKPKKAPTKAKAKASKAALHCT